MKLINRLIIAWAKAPEHPAKQRLLGHAIRRLMRRAEVQLEFGKFYLHAGDFIQRHLMFYGQFEPRTLRLVSSILKEGGCFVDVGANIGLYSIAAANMMGGLGHVIAIEPNPSICAELLENRRLNKCESRITVVNAAVGNQRHLTAFGVPFNGNQGMCREVDSAFPNRFYSFTSPLADICGDLNICHIRLLKIDVEGAESRVLDGILENRRLRPDHIILEYLPDDFHYFPSGPEMLRRLAENGYELATVGGNPLPASPAIEEGNIWAKLITGNRSINKV